MVEEYIFYEPLETLRNIIKNAYFCTVEGNYLIQLAMDHQDFDVFRKFIEEIDKIEILKLSMNIDEAQKRKKKSKKSMKWVRTASPCLTGRKNKSFNINCHLKIGK